MVIGDAEGVWETVVADAAAGRLQRLYRSKPGDGGRAGLRPQHLRGQRYAPISLVQAGRGCRFACDFCSIHAFYGTYRAQRDPADIVAEMRTLPPRRLVFFVDDNLYWRRDAFEALMRALIPLKMRWCCQITIDVARDEALLDLMAAGRLRARADRLRVARSRQPGADAQEVERRRRRLRRGRSAASTRAAS